MSVVRVVLCQQMLQDGFDVLFFVVGRDSDTDVIPASHLSDTVSDATKQLLSLPSRLKALYLFTILVHLRVPPCIRVTKYSLQQGLPAQSGSASESRATIHGHPGLRLIQPNKFPCSSNSRGSGFPTISIKGCSSASFNSASEI